MDLAAGISVIADNLSAVVDTVGDRRLCPTRTRDIGKLAILIQEATRDGSRILPGAHNRTRRIDMDATVRNSFWIINRGHFTADHHKAVHDLLLVLVLPDDHARVVDSSENSGYGSRHIDG